MDDTRYPLVWPAGRPRTKRHERRQAVFRNGNNRITLHAAAMRVTREIGAFTRNGQPWVIDPRSLVVSTNVPVRKDGNFYLNAPEPDDVGVAVYFEVEGQPRCLSCDKWDRVADNVAAIAKHLEAMRGQERWGVATIAAAFAGFAALPAPGETSNDVRTVEEAAAFVSSHQLAEFPIAAEQIIKQEFTFNIAQRAAKKKLHPDRNGGEPTPDWHKLQSAIALLDKHHGRGT